MGGLLQAVIQIILDDGDRQGACEVRSFRWYLYLFELVVVAGLPLWWAWIGHIQCVLLTLDTSELEGNGLRSFSLVFNMDHVEPLRTSRRPKKFMRFCELAKMSLGNGQLYILAAVFYHAARSIYPAEADWGEWWLRGVVPGPICPSLGVAGYQVWPMAVYPHWTMVYCFLAVSAVVGGTYHLRLHPSLVPHALDLWNCAMIPLFLWTNDQWASLWCLGAGCTCAVAVVEPALFRSRRVLDQDVLAPEGNPLREDWLFRLAWLHLDQRGMSPWTKWTPEPAENECHTKGICGGSCSELHSESKVPTMLRMPD